MAEIAGRNDGNCKIKECLKHAHAAGLCPAHYNQQRRRNLNQLCDFPDCKNSLAQVGNRRPVGRRSFRTKYRRLCRLHEHLHLIEHRDPAQSASLEQANRHRVANGITTDAERYGTCWVYGDTRTAGETYPLMRTELSADVQWLAHRVTWGLLMGGHKQRQQLDHLCGCIVGAGCISPVHLEPVSAPENQRRKHARQRVANGLQSHRVKECGHTFNREALESPKVKAFAEQYDLPLPCL